MNKVMLIGNVGKEPDVRYYDADQAVAQVTFATTEKGYTLANGTQVPDRTEWHTPCVLSHSCQDSREVCPQGRQTLCRGQDTLSLL